MELGEESIVISFVDQSQMEQVVSLSEEDEEDIAD